MNNFETLLFKINYKKIIIGCWFIAISIIVSGQNSGIQFIENKGQWKENIDFKAQIPGGSVWLEGNQMTFDFIKQEDYEKYNERSHPSKHAETDDLIIRHHAYRVVFVDALQNPESIGKNAYKAYNNYFIGKNREKWAAKVPIFKQVETLQIYPKIDMLTYQENGHFKYDLIVHPEGNPEDIRLKYEGVNGFELLKDQLLLHLSIGDVIEQEPIAYQWVKGKKKFLTCKYFITNNEVSFIFPKGYNPNYDLIIDPELIFSTYSGSTEDNWGFTATYGIDGSAFGGGIVYGSGYPTTMGSWDQTFSGGEVDIAITKFSADGTDLEYSTYLGGNDSEAPHSLIIDNMGNLVVIGSTGSTNFPISQNAYSQDFNGGDTLKWNGIDYLNGSDIFITKFSADGSELLGSTYIGGSNNDGLNQNSVLQQNYGDQARGDVFIDELGTIYVASNTVSDDFPTTPNSEQQTFQGLQDGCVFSLSSDLSELKWSTYLGGENYDAAYSIKVKNETVQVAGGTMSLDFPTTAESFHPDYLGGESDGFVVFLDTAGSILSGTFVGTSFYDQVYFLDNDTLGNIYVIGQTGGIYPISSNVFSNTNGRQFIQKLTPDLSEGLASTKFGPISDKGNISLTAFLVDDCGHVYASGWGGALPGQSGNTFGMPITPDAYQSTTDGTDFYFIVFSRNFEELLYATYFGGDGVREHVDGGTSRFDKNGIIYQAVCAGCGGLDGFPTTPGAWSNTNGSTNCNLGVIKMEFNLSDIEANISVKDSAFCHGPPYQIPFMGSGSQIANHEWSFGDGTTSIEANPIHSYADTGVYQIKYVVVDLDRCDVTDTAYAQVVVSRNESFFTDWVFSSSKLCEDTLRVNMAFTGTGADSLVWDMDDGTFYFDSAITHTYLNPGVFDVTLTAFDLECDLVDTLSKSYVLDGGIDNGKIDVPNVFTPNSDGVNDEFHVFYPEFPGSNPLFTMDVYKMLIYDRWGRLIFESGAEISDWAWDGNENGASASDGVYFYIVEFDSFCDEEGTKRLSGYVTLLR